MTDGRWLLQICDKYAELTYDEIMRQTLGWLERCDAIYVVARSPGSAIFTEMDQVPDVRDESRSI